MDLGLPLSRRLALCLKRPAAPQDLRQWRAPSALDASMGCKRGPDACGRYRGVRLREPTERLDPRLELPHERLYRQSISDWSEILYVFGALGSRRQRPDFDRRGRKTLAEARRRGGCKRLR